MFSWLKIAETKLAEAKKTKEEEIYFKCLGNPMESDSREPLVGPRTGTALGTRTIRTSRWSNPFHFHFSLLIYLSFLFIQDYK